MEQLGIFGTSGFAREVADIATECGYCPVFIAESEAELRDWKFPDKVVLETDLSSAEIKNACIGVGENKVRKKIADKYQGNLHFPNLVHPSATFGRSQKAKLEKAFGVTVCAGVRFTNNIVVGNFAIFNLNATIGHDVVIEEFVNIAPGVSISGNVKICAGAYIGTGATVNQGQVGKKLVIGTNAIVGASGVVIKDCEANGVYVGNPVNKLK